MVPVKALATDPERFLARFGDAARRQRFRAEPFGTVDGLPLVAFTKRTSGPRPRVYLSAGVHGDEPAPPEALLNLLEQGVFDQRAVWFLCPLLNPTALRQGTRELPSGIDLNRDYRDRRSPEGEAHVRWLAHQPRFDLTINLHEDWESEGFYLYELNSQNRPSLAHAMIAAAAQHGPIEEAEVIDGRPRAERGIIRPEGDPLERENWPEAIYLRAHHCDLCYTTETASRHPLAQRVATSAAAIHAALEALLGPADRG